MSCFWWNICSSQKCQFWQGDYGVWSTNTRQLMNPVKVIKLLLRLHNFLPPECHANNKVLLPTACYLWEWFICNVCQQVANGLDLHWRLNSGSDTCYNKPQKNTWTIAKPRQNSWTWSITTYKENEHRNQSCKIVLRALQISDFRRIPKSHYNLQTVF